MQLGISLYAGVQQSLTLHTIEKAKEEGMHIAFSSLQIPEEKELNIFDQFHVLQQQAQNARLTIFTDISKQRLYSLGVKDIHELKKYGIEYLRLDDGFSVEDIAALSNDFHIVLNASTICTGLEGLLQKCNRSHILACYNYYPEPYTGLTLYTVYRTNNYFHAFGLQTIAFIPGNKHLRGPIYEGLPTIENHRLSRKQVLRNALELFHIGTDIVLIGDIDVEDSDWKNLGLLNQQIINLPVTGTQDLIPYLNIQHHDRVDASEWLFRSVESRRIQNHELPPANTVYRSRGSICVNNRKFERYSGELSIAKIDMPADERVNVIGRVSEENMRLLDVLGNQIAINFILE